MTDQNIAQGLAHLVREEAERQRTAGQLEEAPLAEERWSDDDSFAQAEDTTYDGGPTAAELAEQQSAMELKYRTQ